jgi:hypothetical protein
MRDDGYTSQIALRIVYTNRSDRPVAFENCRGATTIALAVQDERAWREVLVPPMEGCCASQIVVQSGATWQTALNLSTRSEDTTTQTQSLRTPGSATYRITWIDAFYDHEKTSMPRGTIPLEERVSNPFLIVVLKR